jgi:diacylglycerol kinase family enzyme
MVLERERQQGRGYRKFFATIVAFLRIFRRFPRRRLLLCAEGDVRPYRTPCLFVGNNPYAVELTRLGTRERVDGGELCVYVARHAGLLGVMRLAWHAALGNLDQARDFDRRVLRTAEIRSRASRIIVARDGEVERMRPPLRYRIRPGALVVFAPAERA